MHGALAQRHDQPVALLDAEVGECRERVVDIEAYIAGWRNAAIEARERMGRTGKQQVVRGREQEHGPALRIRG